MSSMKNQSSSPDPFSIEYMNMDQHLSAMDPDSMSEISYSHQIDQRDSEDPEFSKTLKGKGKCIEYPNSDFPKLNDFDVQGDAEPFDFTPHLGSKRKGESSKNGPMKKNSGKAAYSNIDMIEGADECIATARDLLIKAAHQAETRAYQTKILDLLNIFRQFMEKDGNIPREASLLATQLQKLEHTAQVLQNTMNQPNTQTKTYAKTVQHGVNMASQSTRGQQQSIPRNVPNSGNNTTDSGPSQPARSWASVAGPSNTEKKTQNQWTVVQPKKKPMPKPRNSNRLILLQDETTRQTFSPLQIRDQINNAFRARGVQGPVVSIVSKTRNENIAISTMGTYTADFLLDQVSIWKNFAPHVIAMKDEAWHKVIIHGVPTNEFGQNEDLSSISEEISVFNNGLKIIGQPFWITPEENRKKQQAGSIVVAFETEAQAKLATSRRLIIAGRYLLTDKYLNYSPTMQCNKCQAFGHPESRCRWDAKCQFCAGPHSTKQHACTQCKAVGHRCDHLVPKCGNCSGSHSADNKDCQVRVTVLERAAAREEQARNDQEECL